MVLSRFLISIPPSSFKPVSLALPRSPLSNTPKQVFFNPINIFDSFTHSVLLLLSIYFIFTGQHGHFDGSIKSEILACISSYPHASPGFCEHGKYSKRRSEQM